MPDFAVEPQQSPASYVVYQAGSLYKAMNGTTNQVDYSNTDAYTLIQTNLLGNLPAISGKNIHINHGSYTLSNSLTPPSYCNISGESRFANSTLLRPTGNFPAVIVNDSIRTTLSNLFFDHVQSGYTSSLLQIRETANTCNYNGLLFMDTDALRVGNAISLSNQGTGSQGILKQQFRNCEVYGFDKSVNLEVTVNASDWINGANFTDCNFWLPKTAAVYNNNITSAHSDFCNFTNIQIQAQTTGPNQTTNGFYYSDSGAIHSYISHVNCMVWDLGSGSNYASINTGTNLALYGCYPSWKITGTGAGVNVVRDYSFYTRKKGRSTFSGNGTTTDFTIAHNMNTAIAPNFCNITIGSVDARGSFIVDDTAFTTANAVVKYAVAPPTGTNNIVLYWEVAYQV